MVRVSLVISFVLTASCERPTTLHLSALNVERSAIVGGTSVPPLAEPTVFLLGELLSYEYNGKSFVGLALCTGTLVGPHSVLTAAHCLDTRSHVQQVDINDPHSTVAPTGIDAWVVSGSDETKLVADVQAALDNGLDPLGAAQSVFHKAGAYNVTTTALAPQWDPAHVSAGFDVAMALIDGAPSATPTEFNTAILGALAGETVRVLGYGNNGASNDTSKGQLREIDLPAGGGIERPHHDR